MDPILRRPQEELILTAAGIVKQPSWHAHALLSHNWGDRVLSVSPNRTTDRGDDQTFLDVLALGNETDGGVVIHATYTGAEARTLELRTVFGGNDKARRTIVVVVSGRSAPCCN